MFVSANAYIDNGVSQIILPPTKLRVLFLVPVLSKN